MFLGDYDTQRLISAFLTILVIGIVFKLYMRWNASRRIKIEKPDWAKKRKG